MDIGTLGEDLLDVYSEMPLDRTISQERLNISDKERSNLFPWNGQFSPQLVEAFLRNYAGGGLTLDPFLGSGTVLCEAGRLGLPCFGTEINPAAFTMARTYRLINLGLNDRRRLIARLDERMHEALPFFTSGGKAESNELETRLVGLSEGLDEEAAILLDTLIVLLDFYQHDLTMRKLYQVWGKLSDTVVSLPFSEAEINLRDADARSVPLPDGAVDLVVTSPPYINVFNYHQQYRASVESLGWDLLEVARSEVGSNRKHRGNRFLTVIQYCLDMTDVFIEMSRVCGPTARLIFVVGRESNVRKTRFLNGEIVAALGSLCAGWSPVARQERVFKNKFGALIYEDILHFEKGTGARGLTDPLSVALNALRKAMGYAPEESKADLKTAIENASGVGRSPLYSPGRSKGSGLFRER